MRKCVNNYTNFQVEVKEEKEGNVVIERNVDVFFLLFYNCLCVFGVVFLPVGLKYENKRKYENTKTLVKSEFLATSTRFRNSAQLTA